MSVTLYLHNVSVSLISDRATRARLNSSLFQLIGSINERLVSSVVAFNLTRFEPRRLDQDQATAGVLVTVNISLSNHAAAEFLHRRLLNAEPGTLPPAAAKRARWVTLVSSRWAGA
jgi:hypothetical protein